MTTIFMIFAIFFVLRLLSLFISIKNEKRLIRMGAVQYGKLVSLLLTLSHICYYISSLYEGYATGAVFNNYSAFGTGLMTFAYLILFYVIYKLRDVWTLKVYIAPNHRIDKSFLFKVVKHPNYFLNIIPELIGLALLCNAWRTLMIGLPFYFILLAIRIVQEERAMKQ